jgi:hypothetical protein
MLHEHVSILEVWKIANGSANIPACNWCELAHMGACRPDRTPGIRAPVAGPQQARMRRGDTWLWTRTR